MIELAQHIEFLLLENDCVIVPGLGGFVAHHNTSARIDEDGVFCAPTRIVGFNPRLVLNDGLLVQRYMQIYNTNFADAGRMVDGQVAELKTTLHNDGCIRLGSIGELRYSATGIYDFTPFDEKLTTPQLYGLYGFEMKRLTDTVTPVVEFPLASKPKRTEWNVWRYVAQTAAMIAIALLILCPSTTVKNTETAHGYYAGLIPAELFKQIETQSLVMTPVTSPLKSTEKAALEKPVKKSRRVVKPIAVKEVKVAKPMATPVKDTQAAAPHKAASKRFHIIVASMPTEKDAMEMAQKLKAEGYAQACALIGDGKMRVCLQTFETEAEAYSNISILRQNEAYKNAWVLKK